ncbi:hypothetical protein [Mucilaginibacter lappiensis]|uniref:Uncharacterized protein n=1 Tax=Mucilaginibacter lappiensis TaxID=354630 RepID=A0A1N7F5I0_9SPHI|nr:hypothetical protein [Mucilaginibacter lappiensis]MBB6112041.1 hypothetical protein [Mucilaginibacter lappiensis]MBB6127962.1 hypothetical protein [Mucilaginibacter lappiensis]SIR95584.1 hypothetical protein SAMN05421821_116140 [Mucilaginibacter lappiensis]
MLRSIPLLFVVLFFCTVVKAQQADSTLKKSPVKTLTDKQYTALLNGEDVYNHMALPAEINHYPMPDQVIKFKKELGLSPNQVIKITAIATELHRKRVEMGGFIITNEQTLDNLFRKQRLNNGDLIFYATRSGLYYGELRNAILQACLSTGDLLAPQQIKKLETLQNPN